jgi:membrane associated rhomboid family serine protease
VPAGHHEERCLLTCPDHGVELRASPQGHDCPRCRGSLLAPRELERRFSGAEGLLTAETRDDAACFVRPRQCPACAAVLLPWRLGPSEAWVDRCAACGHDWLDASDALALERLSRQHARTKAWASFSEAERAEMASGLAERPRTEVLETEALTVQEAALAAAGLPLVGGHLEGTQRPVVTWLLAAVMVALQVAGLVDPHSFGPDALAWRPRDGLGPELLLAGLAHQGWLHLLGNVSFLVVFGDAVERKLPRAWLAVGFPLVAGFTLWCEGLVEPRHVAILGASGGIAALLSLAAVLQPRATWKVRLTPTRALPLPLWFGLLGFAALQGVWLALGVPGVAWVSHLAGLVVGLALGLVARRALEPQTPIAPAPPPHR